MVSDAAASRATAAKEHREQNEAATPYCLKKGVTTSGAITNIL